MYKIISTENSAVGLTEKPTYICRKRAKLNALCGMVNIPYGTEIDADDRFLYLDGSPICTIGSQTAQDYFCYAADGSGKERGKLISTIRSTLEKQDEDHQARWDKVWADELCWKYKRCDHVDYWLWNDKLYSAPIEDLRYIAALIREV